MWTVTLPARINVVGSPTDAVEGAYATISAAVSKRGGATIEAADEILFRRDDGSERRFPPGPIADAQGFAVEAAAVNAFLRHAPELGALIARRGFALHTWTDVPASSGMAGSSVLVLAVLAALRVHYELCHRRFNDYVLAEIAQRAEEHDMGVVCGFADRYVPVFGGIAYLSYHGKLQHAALGAEPFVTYEPLDRFTPALTFCIATTGIERDSGSVHAPMRRRYLEQRQAGTGPLLDIARQIGETAWRGKIALLEGNLAELGAQIDRNQELVDSMMRHCGFDAGAGVEVAALVRAAKEAGALGAKLTGAGGGGAIFALPAPGTEEKVLSALRHAATAAGLDRSEAFLATVSREGLTVTAGPPDVSARGRAV